MSEGLEVFERVVRQEVDQQVATAKAYPRSMSAFRTNAAALVAATQEVAEDCIYTLPRRDKDGNEVHIEGPSARFAEVVAACYQNVRVARRVLDIGPNDSHVTAQAVFYDVENNVAHSVEVRRRITTSNGRRYSDDMVNVTANAASAIAARNAVLTGIPRGAWAPIYDAAKRRAIGEGTPIESMRAGAMAAFAKVGVSSERVLAYLGVKALDEVTRDHLVTLRGIHNAIREGEARADDVFPKVGADKAPEAAAHGVAGVMQRVGDMAPTPEAAAPTEDPGPATPEYDAPRGICAWPGGCTREAAAGSLLCEDHAGQEPARKVKGRRS